MCILESTQHLYDLCKKKSMEINSGDSLRTHSARVNSDSFRVNSARIASSTLWRDASQELFNGSVREEDDEEALQWAALEKLPTYNRLRRGLLAELGVPPREIDIRQLGFDEKRQVLESLMRGGAEDNQQFLLKLRERIDRVGIDIPTVEVRFEKLRVETQVHTGNRALPSISNSFLNMLEGLLNWFHVLPQSKRPLTILEDVSGIVKPGRMALLLGPPTSGKTTLLLALAGILDKDLKVSGKVTYNGMGTNEFVPQRTAAYISQNDLHIPEMTVRETLEFSAKCQGAGTNYDMLLELLRREKVANIKPDANVDIYMKAAALEGQEGSIVAEYILKILGLEACADTMVGNQMIRGISGGEKKRLTTGEMLVGPAKAFFMDEISTGLDTSTTFQIVNCIKQSMQALNGTTIVSLLQPSPEVYELFDDVILLSKGQIVYQGPREHVLEFFEHMGFKCPRRKGVADYLQEVTSRKEQGQYWMHETLYDFVTVKDFANSFRTFHVGQKLEAALAVPFNDAESHPASLTRKCYGVQRKELLRTCMSREFLLMKRNAFVYVFKSMEMTVTALITLTVFLRTEMPKKTVLDGGIFMGSLFFSTMKLMFSGFAELSMTVLQLPVFYKQRELLFYPAWAYSLPKWILKIPISAIEVAIWVLLTYYPIGYDPNVGRFFGQYLLLFLLHNMAFGLFRFIAGIGRTATMANTLGFFIFTIFMVLGGFILSREDVKKWWIWGYWISPLMYLQNALSVNEFLGSNWSQVPLSSNDSLGVQVLKSRGYYPQAYWFWIGVGALIGFIFLFNYMFTLSLKYLNPLGKPQAIIPDESGEEKTNGEGKSLQLSSLQKSSDTQKDTQEHIRSRPLPQPIKPDDQSKKRGMILPFQPLSITFNDIRYSVDIPQAMKSHGFTEDRLELLKGVSGVFRPGVLTALMGVSGAGKTTLMDVLAGRKTGGYIDGEIKISGYPKNQETFARVSGYVEQTDIHSPHVTVYESLLFSAWLRLSPEVDSEVRKRFVSEVMELVELTSLKDALVGLPGVDGLSTEQRKRLTIAVELVANPSIIFMDEPTSGLDARAAAIVLRTVKNTVETGRTIVCTIHQPSIDIFDSFDELLLLKRGGEQIYFGPLGHHACHLIEYFEEINGVSKIKDGHNPATWMMEVSSEAQEAKLGVDFSSIYKNSELYRRTTELIQELSQPAPDSEDLHFTQQHAQPFLNQCMACLWKQNWSYWRNTAYNVTRLLLTLTLAILFGSAFWNVGSKRSKDQDLFNSFGSMYAAILLIGIGNALSVMPIVAVERTVYYRERAAGMYSAFPYAFGQVMIEIPYCMAQTILYGVIVYFMTGYEQTAAKFFWYIFFMFFTLLYFTYYGMMSVAITPNQSVAAIVSTSFYPLWNLFSGFIIPRNRIPIWWRWYYWANPISWSLYGQLASQYGDVKEQMVSGQTVEEFLRSYFGFRHDFVAVVSVMVVGFAVFFALIFAYGIRTLNFQKR